MRFRATPSFALWIISGAAVGSVFLAGCGSGHHSNNTPATPTPSPTATPATPTAVKATIIWPQRSRQATTTTSGSPVNIAALTSASSAVITLTGASTTGGDVTIVAARPSGAAASTPTYTSTDLANPGTYALTVKFYDKPLTAAGAIDTTATVVATAQANTQILANGTLSATITTVGQIQSVIVGANQPYGLGETRKVNFTAFGTPINGQLVIIPVPDGAESVSASNINPSLPPVASVANGLLTGQYPGQAAVTVTVDNITSPAAPITVVSNATVAISPNPANVAVGGSVQLAASVTNATNQTVVWSLGADAVAAGATIDQTGLFTAANRSGGPFTVVATSVYDPTKTATANVIVTSNVVIYPSDQAPGVTTETTAPIGANKTVSLPVTVTGASDLSVTYAIADSAGNVSTSTTSGSVTTAGVFTAPNTEGTFYVKATSVADTSKSVLFTIPVVPSVTISPGKTTISVDQSVTFFANVVGGNGSGVTYAVVDASGATNPNGGTITSSGVYTAPDTAGTYYVKATSVENPKLTDTATVIVQAGSGVIIIN